MLASRGLSESCTKIGDVPKSPVPTLAAVVPSAGTVTLQIELRLDAGARPAWSMTAHRSATMTLPHFISEDKSDMRGIKSGWYAIEDDGNLTSGPFSSIEECVKRITQPTNGTMASKLERGPN